MGVVNIKVQKGIIIRPAHRPIREELIPLQVRFVELKMTTKLNNKQISEQLEVHYNTIMNWNKTEIVQNALSEALVTLKRDNSVGMQKLMSALIREAGNVLDDPEMGNTIKVQLIGQLFTQVGKFSGLEPAKEVKKEIKVTKSFETLMDTSTAIDTEYN